MAGDKLTIEARRRTAMASSAYDAGKKIFFANPCIPLPTKVALFQAAIDPLYFNLQKRTTHARSSATATRGSSAASWLGDAATVHLATSSPPPPAAAFEEGSPEPPLLPGQSSTHATVGFAPRRANLVPGPRSSATPPRGSNDRSDSDFGRPLEPQKLTLWAIYR